MTIHDFDMARYVTGSDVVEVYATGAVRVDPAIGEAGDVDTAVAILTHANGDASIAGGQGFRRPAGELLPRALHP